MYRIIVLFFVLSAISSGPEATSAFQQAQQSQSEIDRKAASPEWQSGISDPLLAQTESGYFRASLENLILSALQNSKKIAIARIDGFVEQERVTQQDANFDWSLFAEELFTNTNQKTGSGLQAGAGVNRLLQQDNSTNVGVRRNNRIGGNLEARQNLRLLDSNSQFIDPNEQGFTQMTLRYNQPLLRDGGRLVNEGQVILAQLNAGTTVAESEAAISEIILEVVNAYWEIYRLRGRYVVQKLLVEKIQRLLTDISKRTKIDAKQSLIGQAESELATQEALLATNRTQLIQAQLKLVRIVGDRNLGGFEEIIPTSHVPPTGIEIDPQSAISLAIKCRPEIRADAQRIRRSELFNQISARQLLPRLALVLETSVNGVNGNFGIGKSLGDQFSEGGPSYAIGLNYEVPIGNRAATSRAREAELLLAREMAKIEDTVDQVRLEVNEAIAGLRGAASQLAIRQDSASKSQQVVDLLLQRQRVFPEEFDQVSQLYVREILDAQQRKSAADQAIVDLLVETATTTINLRKATGTLLGQFGEGAMCGELFEAPAQNQVSTNEQRIMTESVQQPSAQPEEQNSQNMEFAIRQLPPQDTVHPIPDQHAPPVPQAQPKLSRPPIYPLYGDHGNQ